MYLFVAFKPSSVESARGCRIGSYNEDFFIVNNLSKSKLIVTWAEYLLRNMQADYQEAAYDFWIFKDGVSVWSERSPNWDGWENNAASKENLQFVQDEEETAIKEIFDKAQQFANKQLLIIKEEKLAQRKAEVERKNQKTKEERHKQYMELKKEFDQA